MDQIDDVLRDRVQRAAIEIAAKPYRRDGAQVITPRHRLRRLSSIAALPVAVAVAAGVLVFHARVPSSSPSPDSSQLTAPSGISPLPTSLATWDSTHQEIVALEVTRTTAGAAVVTTWTWDHQHRWRSVAAHAEPDDTVDGDLFGVLVDIPPMHGVAFISHVPSHSGLWLWDGATWTRLPAPPINGAYTVASAAFDAKRGAVVAVAADALVCGATCADSPQTWTWDGVRWQQVAAVAPAGVTARLVWDPDSQTIVAITRSLAAGGGGGPRTTIAAWAWDGTLWRLRSVGPSFSDVVTVEGAGWDSARHTLVAALRVSTDHTVLLAGLSWNDTGSGGLTAPIVVAFSDATKGRVLAIASFPGADHTAATGPGGNAVDGSNEPPHAEVMEWQGSQWQEPRG